MPAKSAKPRLSKGILEMKFMQRTKKKVNKELEDEEGRALYSNEINNKMINTTSNFIVEHSFVNCENLLEGRFSFRGMNPELERLLELEQMAKSASTKQEQPTDVSDKDMAKAYYANMAPATTKTMQKKFQGKRENTKRIYNDTSKTTAGKKPKFKKPHDDCDEYDA